MKSIYIKDIKAGDPIIMGETFALTDVKSAQDKNSRTYYDIELSDRTGRMRGKIWSDRVEMIEKMALTPGKVVKVSAKIDEYKGKPQLTILDLALANVELTDEYMQNAMFPSDQMWTELQEVIATIQDEAVRELLHNITNDSLLGARLRVWPAANSIHHNFRSGLLQHILEMLAAAKGMERFYPEANFDLVIAGIILHDIGKLEELDASGVASEYTKKGSLLGHITIGVELVDRFKPADLQENTLLHIKHIILSHHGALEFGSPVVPSTTEALLVYNIDGVSSNARKASQAIAEGVDGDGMTAYNKWMATRFWDGN